MPSNTAHFMLRDGVNGKPRTQRCNPAFRRRAPRPGAAGGEDSEVAKPSESPWWTVDDIWMAWPQQEVVNSTSRIIQRENLQNHATKPFASRLQRNINWSSGPERLFYFRDSGSYGCNQKRSVKKRLMTTKIVCIR